MRHTLSAQPKPRPAFTLVELLVAMSLMILLAALAVGVSQSGLIGSQKVISAGDRVSGWLLIAKQRAMRDNAPRGVRFFSRQQPAGEPTNRNYFTDAQYIEAPEPWVPNPAQEGRPNGARIVFVYNWQAVSPPPALPTFVVKEIYYVSNNPADIGEYDQRVSNGDSLSLPEFGRTFRILNANATLTPNTWLGPYSTSPVDPPNKLLTAANCRRIEIPVTSLPDLAAAGTMVPTTGTPSHAQTMTTYKFGFTRPPQPLLGEPGLQLTGGTAIDLRYAPFTNYMTPPFNLTTTIGVTPEIDRAIETNPAVTDPAASRANTFDILFSPSGQVLNSNAGLICLWVRDVSDQKIAHPRVDSNGVDMPSSHASAGQQVFVVVNGRNGLISTQEIVPPAAPAGYDAYQSAKDGINSGL